MTNIIEQDCLEILKHFNGLPELKNKTFLITGSNGLIGNYFIRLLDIVNQECDANIMAYCVSKHAAKWTNQDFVFATLDLTQYLDLPIRRKIDYIIHAAGYAAPVKFLSNELETIALNTKTLEQLLLWAEFEKAKLLFLSSSEIYGNSTEIPTKETYMGTFPVNHPRASYTEAKRMGEVLCLIYHRKFDVDAKIARLALVYGPGISINDGRVMGDFIKGALVDKHIRLLDMGQVKRTYCYITDAIKMLLNILLKGKDTIYNVGGQNPISILELAHLVASPNGAILSCPLSDDATMAAPDIVQLDITKISQEFEMWKFVDIKEGIKRTIDWNKEQNVH